MTPDARTAGRSFLVLRAREIGGVLFDLDGVLTDTARLHAAAWQRLFEEVFAERRARTGESVRPFDHDGGDGELVNGKLRHDGVRAALASRGIDLPDGDPADEEAGSTTVWGIANRKQVLFDEELQRHGVELLPGAVELVTALRRAGVRTGVVSSSRNADAVLRAARLDVFDVCVDGVDIDLLDLPGKPDPASFLEAATRLGVAPSELVLFEDAPAGVRGGLAAGFGQVIGVAARAEDEAALVAAGATACVREPAAVTVLADDAWRNGTTDAWHIEFDALALTDGARRETLCTLGNGYVATRGAAPEAVADDVHYPGTYAAGVYNRLVTNVHGHELEHEDLVNLPNWLPFTFRVADGEWFGSPAWRVTRDDYRLDLRHGTLVRQVDAEDETGRRFVVEQLRLVSMRDRHLAALRTTITVEGSGAVPVELRSAIDGRVANSGVREYRPLLDRHLEISDIDTVEDRVLLRVATGQSRVGIAVAARTTFGGHDVPLVVRGQSGSGWVAQVATVTLEPGRPLTVDKVAAIFTSRDRAIAEPGLAALDAVGSCADVDDLLAEHRMAWDELWAAASLTVDADGRTQAVVNLHLFHLLQSLSPPHTTGLDTGVTARGLHGEAYRGHVFWDELFVLPLLMTRFPPLARSLLLYRYRRLDRARHLARRSGHDGAMFPWQSGSDGREETPVRLFNVRSRRWMADNSQRQRHVGLAIAHNVWRYVQTAGDDDFLVRYGTELLVEIARFWAGLAEFDGDTGRYDLAGVMGPDEFHDGYPDRPGEGLVNNTYTNVLASWVLCRALDAVRRSASLGDAGRLWERLRLDAAELAHWDRVSRNLAVEFDPAGHLDQFRGYHRLEEFDWDRYRDEYGNIGRLDLILEAEGDDTNRYQLSKQADALMLFYLFSAEEITEQLAHLGYRFDAASIPDTVHHHLDRTSHGSTLSRVAHSWVLARTDRPRSWRLFCDALASDIDDTQGGTTGEGIHLGAMAGTVDLLQRCYSGLEIRDDGLRINPRLPDPLRRLRFPLTARGHRLEIDLRHDRIVVRSRSAPGLSPLVVTVRDDRYDLPAGGAISCRPPAGGPGDESPPVADRDPTPAGVLRRRGER